MPHLDTPTQQELVALLPPLLDREDDRRPLLAFALGTHCPVLGRIGWRGGAELFILHMVGELDRFGEIEPGKQALWKLLETVRERVGLDRQARIDALEPVINRSDAPQSHASDTARGPVATTGPVVFVNYSRLDSTLADRPVADLEQAGHACWLDTIDIPGGEVWLAAIADGIERAHAFVTLVTEAANRSDWVRLEFLHAKQQEKRIILLLAEDEGLPWYMADRQAITLRPDDYDAGFAQLLSSLPPPPMAIPRPTAETDQRHAELSYLRRLQLGELVHTELYTPMAGVAHVAARSKPAVRMPSVVMRPEFQHLRCLTDREAKSPTESRPYQDIVDAFAEVRRAVLLGEPGAGKCCVKWMQCSKRFHGRCGSGCPHPAWTQNRVAGGGLWRIAVDHTAEECYSSTMGPKLKIVRQTASDDFELALFKERVRPKPAGGSHKTRTFNDPRSRASVCKRRRLLSKDACDGNILLCGPMSRWLDMARETQSLESSVKLG